MQSNTASAIAFKTFLAYADQHRSDNLPEKLIDWYRFIAPELPGSWGVMGQISTDLRVFRRVLFQMNALIYPGDWEHIVLRKACMSREIMRFFEFEEGGLIELGAGYDAYRLLLPGNIPVLEVDMPGVVAHKKELYQLFNMQHSEMYAFDGWGATLQTLQDWQQRHQPKRILIQCEGFLEYLSEADFLRLVAALSQLSGEVTILTTQFSFSALGWFREWQSLWALRLLGEPILKNRKQQQWQDDFRRCGWVMSGVPSSRKQWEHHLQKYPGLEIVMWEKDKKIPGKNNLPGDNLIISSKESKTY